MLHVRSPASSSHHLMRFDSGCGHCKTLAPVYELVAKAFVGEPNCVVAKLDATENAKTAEKYGVKGYPTLKFFAATSSKTAEKVAEEYQDGRTAQDFVDYLNEKCGSHRDTQGNLLDSAGVIDDVTSAIQAFLLELTHRAGDAKAKKSLANLQTLIEESKDEASPYHEYSSGVYKKLAAKLYALKEGGGNYIHKQIERLSNILQKGSLISAKVTIALCLI